MTQSEDGLHAITHVLETSKGCLVMVDDTVERKRVMVFAPNTTLADYGIEPE